jgi:hypothetical protein
MLSLLGVITLINALLASGCLLLAEEIGLGLSLILLFDCLIVFLETVKTALLCAVQVHERLGGGSQSDEPAEGQRCTLSRARVMAVRASCSLRWLGGSL